ncbi:MAG: hypothetical protein NNA18_01120 [Nitrospira sp.]|nr:hypothetical protein [Nitrospira sp.]
MIVHRDRHPFLLPALILALAWNAWPTSRCEAQHFQPDNPRNPPAPVYWCPHTTPAQQITVKPLAGCRPLYDKQEDESLQEEATRLGIDLPERIPLKMVDIQPAATKFSDRYRHFLDCCVIDKESPRVVMRLIDEANHILHAIQHHGIFYAAGFRVDSGRSGLGGGPEQAPTVGTIARHFTFNEIVGPVAHAREDLLRLWQHLKRVEGLQQNLADLAEQDNETTGHIRQLLLEEAEAMRQEFRAHHLPSSAPTGMDIEDTTLLTRIGSDIEDTALNAHVGTDIGAAVSPSSNIYESIRPRQGEAVHDSLLPYRSGLAVGDTVLPNSTAFDIDAVQNREGSSTLPLRRVGPSIGDSDLNRRR